MLREISEELRVAFKDRLRDARQVIREHRHDGGRSPMRSVGDRRKLPRPPVPLEGVEILIGRAVSAFDDAMTLAEKLVPVERPGDADNAKARSLGLYFDDGTEGRRAFRRDLYYLAEAVLSKRRLRGRIHESAFAGVHTAMRERYREELAALTEAREWSDRIAASSALCAALLIELADHRPILFNERPLPREQVKGLEISSLTSVVLACGFATVEPEATHEADLIDLAILAADARLDRIHAACRDPDGRDDLARIFAMLLAHFP